MKLSRSNLARVGKSNPILLYTLIVSVSALCVLQVSLLKAATVLWTGGDGDWGTAANWSSGPNLPGPDDDVIIDRPGDITVTHASGTHRMKSLLSQEAFILSGGSLAVSNTVQVNNEFLLSGGTLLLATVLQSTNGEAVIATAGTLDGVSLACNVMMSNGDAYVYITSGLTLVDGAAITLHASGSSTPAIYVKPGTQAISGNGEIVFGGTTFQNYLRLGQGGETILTLDPGVAVRGAGYIDQSSGSTLLNYGAIQADVPGRTLSINLNSFTNSGALGALNGATLSISGSSRTWNNVGIMHVDNATLDLRGTFTGLSATTGFTRSGGVVNIQGTLLGGLALDATTGSWNLNGEGTISGGTVSAVSSAQLRVAGGIFDGVSLTSDLHMTNGSLYIVSGLTLVDGAAITLHALGSATPVIFVKPGTQAITGNGEIVFAGTSASNYLRLGRFGGGEETILTLGPDVTVRGAGYIDQISGSTLLNQGTIQADLPSRTLSVNLNSFTNSGTLRALNGATLSISGNCSLEGGTLNVGINSSTEYGRVSFSGPLTAAGVFAVSTINGFRPHHGDVFTLLTYAAGSSDFGSYGGLDLGAGLFLIPNFGSRSATFTATTYPTNSLPSVFIARSAAGVRVLWTAGYPDWTLESATNLISPVWLPVDATVLNDQTVLPRAAPEQYFRLRN